MNACALYSFFGLLSVSAGGLYTEARIRFYFNSIDEYIELPISEVEDIFSESWYNASRSTVIFTHGFTGVPDGEAVTGVVKAYLKQGESNVALLNWEYLAAAVRLGYAISFASWAVPNAIQLGVDFADTLASLADSGLDLNRTHLVGHSLGAHVFGIAGNYMARKGINLPWITGLDPSGTAFDSKPAVHRLTRGSATFVSIIHTDPGKYGTMLSVGTVDFWPNYRSVKHVQPGCDSRRNRIFSEQDLCNHNRSWKLLADAVRHPGTLIGSYAKNYREWKRKNTEEEILQEIGKCDNFARPGNYYLITNSEAPYGLGMSGLYSYASSPEKTLSTP